MLKNLRNLSLLFLLISFGTMSQGFNRNFTLNGVVINEFMAANVSTIPDQDGEYDDWVEIYNNSSTAINLTGYNISDKPDNLDKWTFPDTTIQAGGFIVVWCDEDSSQAGLHANFKLSSTLGEEILLSDPSLGILDDVVFGPQKADTTTGRFPNGAGPFIEMRPTFGSENVNGFPTGIGDPNGSSRLYLAQNFPNPFSGGTIIPIFLPESCNVKLDVRDIYSHSVIILFEGKMAAGRHQFQWRPDGIAPGIYICTLREGTTVRQIKLVIK